MKVIVAPQSFKGTLSAWRAAKAIEKGILEVLPETQVILAPVGDGGDGTLKVLVRGKGGELKQAYASGPFGDKISVEWGAVDKEKLAIIEAAEVVGLAYVPEGKENPLLTTTFGVGEIIKLALDEGYRKFLIGVGGTSTNDGGAGMAQALGARFLDGEGKDLLWGGESLLDLSSIDFTDFDPRVKESEFIIACDVINPITGSQGTSAIYGPQKGADSTMIAKLETSLFHYSQVVRRDTGVMIDGKKWAGSGGGLAGGCMAFLGGKLNSGIDVVLDVINFDAKLEGCDFVITGEGCLDDQTANNKAPMGVAARAQERSIPVLAIVGKLGENYQAVFEHGIMAAMPTNSESLDEVEDSVVLATREAIRWMLVGGRIEWRSRV